MHNGILILPHYVCFIGKSGLKQPLIFTGLAKHGWRQNFMYLNQETNWWIMESWFNLIMFFIDMVGLKLLVIFTRLAQTWLETKFHLSKARNQVWVNNGTLILPRCPSFIGNSGWKQPAIFTGLAKHKWRQSFMDLTLESKIWCIMITWFHLIM